MSPFLEPVLNMLPEEQKKKQRADLNSRRLKL